MKDSLTSNDIDTKSEVITALRDATNLLLLNFLEELFNKIETTNSTKELSELVKLLEDTLEELKKRVGKEDTKIKNDESQIKESKSSEDIHKEEKTQETIQSDEEFLGDIKPIPFEFSLHIASKELNLPEDLVLEFINDFSKQGHENLPILIKNYKDGDLDELEKTAHLLKGAASNLRIEGMVDNLYQLQVADNLEKVPAMIRKFAGQLMALDNILKRLNS